MKTKSIFRKKFTESSVSQECEFFNAKYFACCQNYFPFSVENVVTYVLQ